MSRERMKRMGHRLGGRRNGVGRRRERVGVSVGVGVGVGVSVQYVPL